MIEAVQQATKRWVNAVERALHNHRDTNGKHASIHSLSRTPQSVSIRPSTSSSTPGSRSASISSQSDSLPTPSMWLVSGWRSVHRLVDGAWQHLVNMGGDASMVCIIRCAVQSSLEVVYLHCCAVKYALLHCRYAKIMGKCYFRA